MRSDDFPVWRGLPPQGASWIVRGRRFVNRKACAALFAGFVVGVWGGVAAQVPARPFPAEVPLEAAARALSWEQGGRLMVASHALQGISVVHLPEGSSEAPAVLFDADRPTLDALSLGDGRFLLGRRWGTIELVEIEVPENGEDRTPGIRSLAEWDSEGMPTHLMRRGDLLLVAAGPSGLLVYDWPGEDLKLHLRARYPVVDFTKQVIPGEDDLLMLADNFDYGMQLLRLSDPERPEYVVHRTGDFIDTVDGHEGIVAAGFRRYGVVFFDVAAPEDPERVHFLPLPSPGAGMVQRVRYNDAGELLVSEGASGARLVRLDKSVDEGGEVSWDSTVLQSWPGGTEGREVREGIFLGGDWVALSEGPGNISFHRLERAGQEEE